MDVRKESHVVAALKYIEENLPVGEDGLYGLVTDFLNFIVLDGVRSLFASQLLFHSV